MAVRRGDRVGPPGDPPIGLSSARYTPGSLAAVAAGGAAGTVARAAIEQGLPDGAAGFPWATLAVNLGGSLVLGMLVGFLGGGPSSRCSRLLLGTGVCGGLTTFSTFAVESDALLRAGRVVVAVVYAGVSVSGGLAAAVAGRRITGLRQTAVWEDPV